jgi:hypothetical protein
VLAAAVSGVQLGESTYSELSPIHAVSATIFLSRTREVSYLTTPELPCVLVTLPWVIYQYSEIALSDFGGTNPLLSVSIVTNTQTVKYSQ